MFASNTSAANGAATYIEDVFSTYLYTGNGSTQTITNGIDLAGKGGLVWLKKRNAVANHGLFDTVRGTDKVLVSNTTAAETTYSGIDTFNADGFILGSGADYNQSTNTFASWTFRKQPKFFDVVTYTGDGTGLSRQISHSLGSAPGCIIIKQTSAPQNWKVYHQSLGNNFFMELNTTGAATNQGMQVWNSQATYFSTASYNTSGSTYIAYLFAHNAGGFGLTGTDNVISCGSFTTDGSGNATVTLGYEPQWVLYKPSTAVNNWKIFDNMRGMVVGNGDQALYPNTSGAEVQDDSIQPAATGFSIVGGDASATHIYIAIRRGPMKTPTTGTSVFAPVTYTGTGTAGTIRNTTVLSDFILTRSRDQITRSVFYDRLRGGARRLVVFNQSEVAETTTSIGVSGFDMMNGYIAGADKNAGAVNYSGWTYVNWVFRRAPLFFEEICFTGTGSATTFSHGLGVAPELWIVKGRSAGWSPVVGSTALSNTEYLFWDKTDAKASSSTYWNSTYPSSTALSLGTNTNVNASATTYAAYLFASCPGVSKVGSYTGTGTTQQINCGFTSGARFIMVKSTSTTGDWIVVDAARGLVSGNDPTLALNSTAAEVTTNDWFDPYSAGFELSSVSGNLANTNGTSYIYLAIA